MISALKGLKLLPNATGKGLEYFKKNILKVKRIRYFHLLRLISSFSLADKFYSNLTLAGVGTANTSGPQRAERQTLTLPHTPVAAAGHTDLQPSCVKGHGKDQPVHITQC